MPVSKSLKKVAKKVKGQDKSLHPNGRKFKQMSRATLREEKLQKNKIERHGMKEAQLFRYKFFQQVAKSVVEKNNKKEASDDTTTATTSDKQEITPFTEEQIKDYIVRYIARDNEELEQLKAKRRPGRPASSQQDALQTKINKEKQEYRSGFMVPDLTDKENIQTLLNWNGTSGGLNIIKKIRVSEEGGIERTAGAAQEKDVDME